MNTTVTSEQITSYQKNGFVYHPRLLSREEVAELKAAVLTTVDSMKEERVADGGAKVGQTDYEKSIFTQRLNLWRINETVKKFMLNPALGQTLSKLAGVEGFRVWHDQALIKEPFGSPTGWHLDNPYWSFYSKNSISIWIALEDATLENGCMYFMPGSQEFATFENVPIQKDLGALFKVFPKMGEIDTVAVPMKAGDCSFHNGLTAHGAGANMTRGRRIAMTCAYMPFGSTFNGQQNILPDAYFKTLKNGDLLENNDWNPVV